MLFFSVAILRIIRIRARQAAPQGGGALGVVVMLLLVTLLAAEWPYRFVWKNSFERITVGDTRCYAIGESNRQLLAFCPDVRPPRNRIIASDSANLRRSGVFESIFTPADGSEQ